MKKLLCVPMRWGVLFFAWAFLLPSLLLPCQSVEAKEQERVLKVAFPEVEGFSETDKDGTRHGVVADYLTEIAKYTGWKYEYIDADGETMIGEFLQGKYDLMGGTYYMPEFEEYFAYPEYNTGYSKSVLLSRKDDESIKAYDWKTMSGKTIGVFENAKENIRRLEEFLRSNAMDCEIKYFKSDQLTDGKLYPYLENGQVDMLLGNNSDKAEAFRTVAEFDSQPHYIVTTLDNKEVLDGLNMAMGKILDSNPNFAKERYNANFQDSGIASIFLNQEEKDYISGKKEVSVAVMGDFHPLFCGNSEDELHDGFVPDVLEKVKEFTGLEFTYIHAADYAEALELVKQGKADMLGAFLGNEEEGGQMNLALTKPYATLNDIVARNKSVSYPSEGLVGAVIEGRRMPAGIETKEVKYYPDVQEALQAVERGKADFFYGLSPRIEQEIQERHYTNVIPNTLVNERNDISFALTSPAEADLLTIMNKAINSLTNEEKDDLLNQNLISAGASSFSFVDMIYANPMLFALITAGVFLLLAVLVLTVSRSRIHAARMQSSLEKAEASSRAKGEFLSRMSHEIRTPMNAIVGLSDLTCMMEGVPDKVQKNLTKIRSSSHYLLNLISDILDMSRIENGAMTMASESFSINQTLDELKSMMTAESRRRGIDFTMEAEIRHDALIGDAVRLKQVLTNLISNAFKFTPVGGKVLARVKETGESGEIASFSFQVEDNGAGISEENQKRIFEAFEQVGNNYSKSQGTGLGLAISKTIVQLMGGKLQLKSQPGKGSEFYFAAAFPMGDQEEESEEANGENFLEKFSILLAEDNDLNAEVAEELLKMQGASVQRAENGSLAVDMFRDSSPGEFQAILMDIQMPVMDGLKACRAIRNLERPDAPGIPIIAMTANSFKEDLDAATAAGMNGYVTKPVDVSYLYQVLRKALNRS